MKPVGNLPASRDQINIHAEELSGAIKTKQLRNQHSQLLEILCLLSLDSELG